MPIQRLSLAVLLLRVILFCHDGGAQNTPGLQTLAAATASQRVSLPAEPSLRNPANLTAYSAIAPEGIGPLSRFGFAGRAGLGGLGFDLATSLTRRWNLRLGSDFFNYATTFHAEGASINARLRVRTAHGALDWRPFAGRFLVSPQVIFANNNRVQGTYLLPAGGTITLNGQKYISSATDPFHGAGSIDFRKASPGFTLGFGNLLSRRGGHFSAPVEIGFYYAGPPNLKVAFSGSVCYPGLPKSVACVPASENPDFQQLLNTFIARNRHNLSYASYFPIFSTGVGYVF